MYVRLLYTAQCTWPFVGCAFDTEPSARDHLLDRSEVDLGVEHMFCFTLGHGLLNACIAEARRILRPWGVLFIYDLTTEDTDYVIPRLGYKPHPPHEVLHAAMRHGFKATSVIEDPPHSTADFTTLFGPASLAAHGLDRTWPVVFRFESSGDAQ